MSISWLELEYFRADFCFLGDHWPRTICSKLSGCARIYSILIHALICRLQTFLITNRNELVSQSLRQEYGGVMTNRTPMVFCVSNTMYWKYRHATCATALQFLQLSGIIGLRQYSISMVSDNQHRIATRFMRHDVPSLLSDIELWLHSGADTLDAERRARITRTMNGLEHRLISVRTSLLRLLVGVTKARLTELAGRDIECANSISYAP